MKKSVLFLAIGATLFLAACGDKDEATNVPNNAPVEQNNSPNNATTTTTDSPFNFTHFDLEVEYTGKKSYKVDYENEKTGTEAKIDDEVNNKVTSGNEAVNTLVPIFEQLTFDASTPDEQLFTEILEKFNLPDNYVEIELEVKFADGTSKEYHKVK